MNKTNHVTNIFLKIQTRYFHHEPCELDRQQFCFNPKLCLTTLYTDIHTYIHAYIHTYITSHHSHYITLHYITFNTYIHYITLHYITFIHTYIQTYIHTLHTYIHTCMHACIHTLHTYIHACMHACIHTYIYIYILLGCYSWWCLDSRCPPQLSSRLVSLNSVGQRINAVQHCDAHRTGIQFQ